MNNSLQLQLAALVWRLKHFHIPEDKENTPQAWASVFTVMLQYQPNQPTFHDVMLAFKHFDTMAHVTKVHTSFGNPFLDALRQLANIINPAYYRFDARVVEFIRTVHALMDGFYKRFFTALKAVHKHKSDHHYLYLYATRPLSPGPLQRFAPAQPPPATPPSSPPIAPLTPTPPEFVVLAEFTPFYVQWQDPSPSPLAADEVVADEGVDDSASVDLASADDPASVSEEQALAFADSVWA
jgi:hypothetical protein